MGSGKLKETEDERGRSCQKDIWLKKYFFKLYNMVDSVFSQADCVACVSPTSCAALSSLCVSLRVLSAVSSTVFVHKAAE